MYTNGVSDKVRLLGIDSPEIFSENIPYEYGNITNTTCLAEWSQRATEFAVNILEGKAVTLILDSLSGERDFFDRLLAYIVVDGQDFNASQIEQGYARVYTEGDSGREQEYLELQTLAKSSQVGLWQCGEEMTLPTPTAGPTFSPTPSSITTPFPTLTPTLQPSTNQVIIECIFYDGLVPRSEADEYVQIANVGANTIDVDGWRLVDISEGFPTVVFPSYFLAPEQRIRVYTNQIHVEWGGFSFGYGRAVWNNSEPDVASLFDAGGREVSRKSYPPGC